MFLLEHHHWQLAGSSRDVPVPMIGSRDASKAPERGACWHVDQQAPPASRCAAQRKTFNAIEHSPETQREFEGDARKTFRRKVDYDELLE